MMAGIDNPISDALALLEERERTLILKVANVNNNVALSLLKIVSAPCSLFKELDFMICVCSIPP